LMLFTNVEYYGNNKISWIKYSHGIEIRTKSY